MSRKEDILDQEVAGLLETATELTCRLRELASDGDLNRIAALLEERGTVLNRLFLLRRTRPLTRRGQEPENDSVRLHESLEALRSTDAEFRSLLEQRKRMVLGKMDQVREQRHLQTYSK
jgi:hypothetical protein